MTENSGAAQPTVLIIEDDPKLATIFGKAVQMANFEAEIIHDGRLALERLRTIQPQIVVLDLHLPYVSGEDILCQIRDDEYLLTTKVVVVTADLYKAKTLQHAADVVVLKPLGFERLYNLIISLQT